MTIKRQAELSFKAANILLSFLPHAFVITDYIAVLFTEIATGYCFQFNLAKYVCFATVICKYACQIHPGILPLLHPHNVSN